MGRLRYKKMDTTNSTLCLQGPGDYISDTIRRIGHWYDCVMLRRLWHAPTADGRRGGIFLEVGANIGACTLEFLLMTDAHIIAVEPSPYNLFHLTRTLRIAASRNPALASRVAVLTLGAGDRSIRDAILRTPHSNAGNSQIETDTEEGVSMGNFTQQVVRVEPLDTIFPARSLSSVRLLKIDTEGYECNVLRGARQLLSSGVVQRITAEVNPGMLQRAGCSRSRLHRELLASGLYNISLRPTMKEATFIAQHTSGPQVVCTGSNGCSNAPLHYWSADRPGRMPPAKTKRQISSHAFGFGGGWGATPPSTTSSAPSRLLARMT